MSKDPSPKGLNTSTLDTFVMLCVVIWGIVHGYGCLNDLFMMKWIVFFHVTSSQIPNTRTHYSKALNPIQIHNHRLMIPLGGDVWLVEETFLVMVFYNIP